MRRKGAPSQNDKILEYLKGGATISEDKAIELFRCYRLSARIKDLRNKGYNIIRADIPDPFGTFAVYSLEQEEKTENA